MGVPTVAFFSNWTGEYAVDPDEEAGRLLTQVMVERLRSDCSDALALVVASRGGYPAFADMVMQTARHLDVELRVIIPCRVDGAASLIALGAQEALLHPQAGLGPVDSGLCVAPSRKVDASLLDDCPLDPVSLAALDPAEELEVGRLTYDRYIRRQQRRLVERFTTTDDTPFLIEDWLGRGGTGGRDELLERGVKARVAPIPLAEQLEELLEWAREALHLFRRPEDRFQFSGELADEVEFEPATEVAAGAIVSIDRVWLHELDTGSPDPHAPCLLGEWRGWTSESESECGDEEGEE